MLTWELPEVSGSSLPSHSTVGYESQDLGSVLVGMGLTIAPLPSIPPAPLRSGDMRDGIS